MSKRKLKVLSLSDKLKIVNAFECGKSRHEIQSEFGLPDSTFYKIIKSKDSIKSQCFEGRGNIKRCRPVDFPDIEKCLLEWIQQTLDKNIPIERSTLRRKSIDFATKLGVINFSGSNGWLESFMRRRNINFLKKATEISVPVEPGVSNQWTEDLPNLLKGYNADDIYNADETALFFQCLPDKTFAVDEKNHEGKQRKERLTILQCVNMSGTDKLPLLIVGKTKRSKCFKDVKTLPVDYASNTNACMTKVLFKDWLEKVDEKMKEKQRKILLFIDICAAHTDLPELENVEVIFFPANSTTKLQPLDNGIKHIFKRLYCKEVVQHTFLCREENINPDINLLLAMKFARKAWFTVSDVTVKNCFKKAGFCIITVKQEVPEYVEIEVGPSNEVQAEIPGHESVDDMSTPSFEDLVLFDEDLATAAEYIDDEIVQDNLRKSIDGNESDDETDIDRRSQTFDTEVEIIPKKQEVFKALDKLHKFFEYSAVVDQRIFDKIYELENYAQSVKNE